MVTVHPGYVNVTDIEVEKILLDEDSADYLRVVVKYDAVLRYPLGGRCIALEKLPMCVSGEMTLYVADARDVGDVDLLCRKVANELLFRHYTVSLRELVGCTVAFRRCIRCGRCLHLAGSGRDDYVRYTGVWPPRLRLTHIDYYDGRIGVTDLNSGVTVFVPWQLCPGCIPHFILCKIVNVLARRQRIMEAAARLSSLTGVPVHTLQEEHIAYDGRKAGKRLNSYTVTHTIIESVNAVRLVKYRRLLRRLDVGLLLRVGYMSASYSSVGDAKEEYSDTISTWKALSLWSVVYTAARRLARKKGRDVIEFINTAARDMVERTQRTLSTL